MFHFTEEAVVVRVQLLVVIGIARNEERKEEKVPVTHQGEVTILFYIYSPDIPTFLIIL